MTLLKPWVLSVGILAALPATLLSHENASDPSNNAESIPDSVGDAYDWRTPDWLPLPPVPADNPMSKEKVTLGRFLFYDARLSSDNTMACASCHEQELAFTDGKMSSDGFGGARGHRNAQGLANVAYLPVLTWANPLLNSLEFQALTPLFGEDPNEMGNAGQEEALFARLRSDNLYTQLFSAAFPDRGGEVSLYTITRALAAFQRTMISVNSPYDQYKYGGKKEIMTDAALRGEELFFSEKTECYHCHQGFNFTDTFSSEKSGFDEVAFHNTGLYNLDQEGSYPAIDQGLYMVSTNLLDRGRFRTPSLRNIGYTAPYFHDGSAATLDDVLDHYALGGREIHEGPLSGDGSENPFKSPLVLGFSLTQDERSDLKAFLHSLDDSSFVTQSTLADPWPANHPATINRKMPSLSVDASQASGKGWQVVLRSLLVFFALFFALFIALILWLNRRHRLQNKLIES